MKSGFILSVLVALVSWATGSASNPIVNPAWVKGLQDMLVKATVSVPMVSSSIAIIPQEPLVAVFSILIIWAVASFILSKVVGFRGIMLAAFFGAAFFFMLSGFSIFDIFKNIFAQMGK